MEEVGKLGVELTWRAADIAFQLPDPRGGEQTLPVGAITANGKFYVGFLNLVAARGHDYCAALNYAEGLCRLLGTTCTYSGKELVDHLKGDTAITGKSGSAFEGYVATKKIAVEKIQPVRVEFLELVRKYVEQLRASGVAGSV